MTKRVVKSVSLPGDVAEYLDTLPNASAEVTRLLRRSMLNDQVQALTGRKSSPERIEKAREWARRELDAAKQDVEAGAYEDIRSQMGYAA
ncbi:MAG TPA: hypothetical protein DGT23_04705 [Micromonosporaceae bacterium]|nr:hypothetical protein [Micromonosporaceae bacterium]